MNRSEAVMTVSPKAASRSGKDSFERLYAVHHRTILAYCARRVSRTDAWDAASDVFLVAWRRLHEVPPIDEARAWLIGVAVHVLANQRRSESRRARLLQRSSQNRPWAPMPDELLLRNEEDREVLEALSRLSPTYREIIQLTLWEELSPAEIAMALRISRDAVDQRYLRAKRRLARELALQPFINRPATRPAAKKGGVT
jgi:RNA polymerase sigma-70 factor (ECF subfamily)